ncbi:MFS transporter [Actinokineospora auranticolor]|uniref:Putative MFS family arabinose efflux permease n=1 Tax=Actinokineospora auranticolor TaxID=155976 RepID=A0A2S6GGP1_9PSEU|nr:MFS transporter [Actinokineospora auranticolor]PPK64370.1 putative MFS family arabinose efflux permease [Actinokineospora auranticolor]
MPTNTVETRLPLPPLVALAMAAFVTVLTESLPAGVLPAMSRDLGVTESAMGQSVTIYAVGTALAAVPLTAATATWRRKRLLLTGIAGFAVGNTVTAVSSDYTLTLGARFVAGLAAGLVWALLAGYAARMVPEPVRGRAIAVVMTGIPLSLSVGVPAGTFLGGAVGWRVTFWVMTALAVVLLAWITAAVPDFPGNPRGGRVPVRQALKVPGVATIMAVTGIFVLAHSAMYTYIAPFLGDTAVDTVLLVFGVAATAGVWVVGAHIDRHLRLLTLAALTLVLVAAVLFGLGATPYVAAALWGLGFGGIPTLLQTAAAGSAGEAGDTAQAVLVTLWNAATAIGAVAGGIVLDTTGSTGFPWLLLAFTAFATAAVAGSRRHGFPVQAAGAS